MGAFVLLHPPVSRGNLVGSPSRIIDGNHSTKDSVENILLCLKDTAALRAYPTKGPRVQWYART